jgi:hypothetical protein
MTADDPGLSLLDGMIRSGMSFDELWVGQLALGGEVGRLEVEAYVLGLLVADQHRHDLLAQTLNERFIDRGENHPVGYWAPTRSQSGQ